MFLASGKTGVMATQEEITADLALYRAARAKILEGNQSYTIGRRQFTRASLAEVQAEINRLEVRLSLLQAGGQMTAGVVSFGGRR